MESCPNCASDDVKRPTFTWWGGALGAALLRHRICRLCRFAFDGKTRTSNRRAVACYVVLSNAVVLAILTIADKLLQ